MPYSCNGDNIEKTKEKFRSDKIAMIQADVLGHSMGGILSREWEGLLNPEYKREDNFEGGDIHKLITLDSPHFGAFLADFAIEFINALDPVTKNQLLNKARKMGFTLDKGAIEDLQTTSVAIMYLNSVPTYSASHAIVGDFTVNVDLSLVPGDIGIFYSILKRFGFNTNADMIPGTSDLVVSVKSQQGGLASFASSTFNHHHTNAVGQEVVNEIFELLNISKRESLFESGFPINKWPEWQSK